MLRFQITVQNVYKAQWLHSNISQLASYKNQVAGWIKEDEVEGLREAFPSHEIKLIPSDEYWANYDKYNS